MRPAFLSLLLVALPALARVTFVSPLQGAQAVGPQWLEVTTDAANVDRVELSVDGVLVGVARKAPWRVAHDFGAALAPHVVTAKVLSNGYRGSESASITTAVGETFNVDLVEVPLRLRSSRTVRAEDLRLTENGIEQTIRELAPDRGPARFVFVIDRSLSMGEGRLAAALRAVDSETRFLRPGDSVSVILFNHNVAAPREVGKGEKVATLFAGTTPSGGTSLRDALASIPSRPRTYAIVITDGGDRNSELSEEAALRRISNTKTVVDGLVLGDRSRFLETAAKNTGGRAVEVERDELGTALHELIEDINSRYTLAYQSHGAKPGWRAITITAKKGVTVGDARRGYFAE
ncbi:MAG TPA: VWA domain-containing protein [Thermoanaerobaculia bacterium]|nr:VWA domain-containing protein [Thermoanaerobaculia bacterium]